MPIRFHRLTGLLAALAGRLLSRRTAAAARSKRPRASRPPRGWFERLETREVFNATYHGGTLLTHVDAQPVFLGTTWNSNPTLSGEATALNDYVSYLVQSPFMDLMTDAGYNVGQGTETTAVRVDATLATTITDAAIRATLQSMINQSLVSQPTTNKLYLIYIPSGVTVNNNGATSITTFLGYHGAFAGKDRSGVPFDLHYAVLPHPGTPNPTSASQGFTGLAEVQTLMLGGTAGGTLTPALNGVLATTPITRTDEVQTLTLGGTSNGVVTLSYDGVTAQTPLIPGNEAQQLDLSGADGGIVRLSYNGVIGSEATKLLFQAGISPTAADVFAHLTSIPALSSANAVQVAGDPGGPFAITFGGLLAGANAGPISATATDGTIASVTTQTEGSISKDIVQANLNTIPALAGKVQVAGSPGGPFNITFIDSLSGQTVKTIAAAATAGTTATIAVTTTPSLPTAAQVQASLNTITGLTGNVTVTGNPGGPFTITVKNGGNIANLDVSHFTGGLTAVVTPISDGGATSDLDQLMSVTSHELAEAVTDPNVNYKTAGWFDDATRLEIGDITAASTHTTRLGSLGYLTQNLFDQKVNITAADATATPLITLPTITGAPMVLSLTTAQVNWDQVSGATGYRVLLVNGGQTSLLARVPAMSNGIPVTSAVLTGLHPLVNQTIRVEAYNAANKAVSGDVSFSMPLPAVVAPTITSAKPNPASPQTSAVLTWSGNGGAAGYRVFIINGSRRTLVATLGDAAATATINGLRPGSTVSFRIEAFRGSQVADSVIKRVTLPKGGLVAPQVTRKALAGSVVQLSWAPVPTTQGYRVYRMSGSQRILVSTLSASTTLTKIGGLPAGTKYLVEAFHGTLKADSKWV